MLVSPTEPALLKQIGRVSSTPEKYGVDFLFVSRVGIVGVQRKEVNDLIASLRDGRLAKEMGQWGKLHLVVLIVEGKMSWSTEGYLVSARQFTQTQMNGILFSVQMTGAWFMRSETMDETASIVRGLENWLSKERHGSLNTRPKAKGEWGNATSREWGVHLLQSFNGVGAEVAGRIYDHFDGLPLRWTCSEDELRDVRGVGYIRAERMMEALRGRHFNGAVGEV